MLKAYKHKVQYYETDKMAVVHHSNYIRWFEEARTDLMEQLGFGYARTEAEGIMIPVLEVTCKYRSMVRYGEEVYIIPKVEQFNGIRMGISYQIFDAITGELRTTGESKHCFIDSRYRPISILKVKKEMFDIYKSVDGIDCIEMPSFDLITVHK